MKVGPSHDLHKIPLSYIRTRVKDWMKMSQSPRTFLKTILWKATGLPYDAGSSG